jgi:uncharacterized protein
MDDRVSQHLRIHPGEYVIEHVPHGTVPPPGADWLALVRAPEGLTIVRPAAAEEPAGGRWVAYYGGQTAHGLDVPGMLAAVVNPLAQAGLSVFVTSTYHADLVFVPAECRHEAAEILRRAGHMVQEDGEERKPGSFGIRVGLSPGGEPHHF